MPGFEARAAYLRAHPNFGEIPGIRGHLLSTARRDLLRTLATEMRARGLYGAQTQLVHIEWSIRSLAECLRAP